MSKLNFLLVMPRLVQNIGEGYTFPMGIAYVSASLKKAGYNVFTLNLNHTEGDVHDILQGVILSNKIDAVATGGYSSWCLNIYTIVKSVKLINEHIITIVGGAIVTAEPEVALEALEYADIGVIGEGERTICDLAKQLEANSDISSVNGLIYLANGRYCRTVKQDDISNLNNLPWPDYDGFQFKSYLATRGDAQVYSFSTHDRTAYVMGSRSCPYKCTFCAQGITGSTYRQRSMDSISDEIVYLKEKYGVNAIIMTDELFGTKSSRVSKFANIMQQLSLPWEASLRIDSVNSELVDILKNSTCFGVLFGIESGDNRILKSMKKGISVKQIDEALRLVYDAGIMMDGNLIFGDIEETLETARITLKWWSEHAQYALAMSVINPYPGTDIYKYACREKLITDPVKFLKEGGMQQVNVSKMNDDEVGVLSKEIMETAYKFGPSVQQIYKYKIDTNGLSSFTGKCCRCGCNNSWHDIQLFTRSRIICKECHQKHYAPILPEIKDAFASRIIQLLEDEKGGKIAIWGVLDRSISIMDEMSALKDPNIIFIDNAYWKQKIILNGKKVHSPSAIEENNIRTLITFYVEMGSFQQVLMYTQKFCHAVKQVVRADQLLQGFELKSQEPVELLDIV